MSFDNGFNSVGGIGELIFFDSSLRHFDFCRN